MRLPDFLRRAWARFVARVDFWGTRLNAIAALLIAFLVANAAQVSAAIATLIPPQYQAFAGVASGLIAFLIVNMAATSDQKKAGVDPAPPPPPPGVPPNG